MAPEEPTSDPVMMSRSLLSMKPAAAAAQPEYELSIETTTGMSPPPMAATMWKPSRKPMRAIAMTSAHPSTGVCSPTATKTIIRTKNAAKPTRLSRLRPGSMSGADFIRADSLRNATTEPVNV